MKISRIQQIIKEEVAKAISEVDKNQDLNDKFRAAVGWEPPPPGPGNRLRSDNSNDEKEYTFNYAYWLANSPDDYEFDNVTVTAPNEEIARDRAYIKARQEHRLIRGGKEKFELLNK